MKNSRSFLVPLLSIVFLVAGALQGRHLAFLEESERFYRWMVSASTQMRLFGDPGKPPPGEDPAAYVDNELFADLVDFTESRLPDVSITDADYDKNTHKPYAKVVRYTAAPTQKDIDDTAEAGGSDSADEEKAGVVHEEIHSKEQIERDRVLWALARSDDAAPLRKKVWDARRDGKLAGLGTQLNIAGLYQERGTQISLANMFFGFRKMAANLVWLEVDRFWHKGQMHRMLPLMKTCVTLDPEFIDAYLLGAWHMAYNATAPLEDTPWELRHWDPAHEYWVGDKERYYFYGVDFLKDGIRKNPRNYKLYFDLGFAIYEVKLNDHVDAIAYLSEAIRLEHDRWVERTLYRIKGLDERYEESLDGWQDYMKKFPDNLVAPRFAKYMQGEILSRDTDYEGEKARAAEKLAALAGQKGDSDGVARWNQQAADAHAKEKDLYSKTKALWASLNDSKGNDSDKDTYAAARSLAIQAAELRSQGRYDEAAIAIDQARWASAEFWDKGTDLLIKYKREGNLPLALTEVNYLARKSEEADYTRHMQQSIAGRQYRFFDGTWTCTEYKSDTLKPLEEGSEEVLKLEFDHPEIIRVLEDLDGNIVFQAGNDWYEYHSKEPAKPSKLNPYIPS